MARADGDGPDYQQQAAAFGPQPYFFQAGFAALKDQLGEMMGEPLELEHPPDDAAADAVQLTTTGLAVYRVGHMPSFTDGDRTWALATAATPSTATAPGGLSRAQPPPAGPSFGGVWDSLAACESGGNWASTSNPRYKGGLQEDAAFWAHYGGLAYAPAPHLASRAQQIAVAQRGQAAQGWAAWPACSRQLGLR